MHIEPGAALVGYWVLVTLYDNDPAKWIKYLQGDTAGRAQKKEDLPFALAIQKHAKEDPSFLLRTAVLAGKASSPEEAYQLSKELS